jgi:hypothetical protein
MPWPYLQSIVSRIGGVLRAAMWMMLTLCLGRRVLLIPLTRLLYPSQQGVGEGLGRTNEWKRLGVNGR